MQRSGGERGGAATAAPTGCFKCGRPGHWSRDCPSSGSNPNPNPSFSSSSKLSQQPSSGKTTATTTTTTSTAAKKPNLKRPKLTEDLLLSDDGLGFVLRHFPRSFKYHGRGHEVNDLGNLIGLYAQWHSHLIPYYSFDQFVQKIEKVGASKRVRRCIRELRERVSRGGDPTKLHEPPVEQVAPDCGLEGTDMGDTVADIFDPPMESRDVDSIQEDMFNEIFQKATEEPSQPLHPEACEASGSIASSEVNPDNRSLEELPSQAAVSGASESSKTQITEEQRARMEANRLKALERALARARSSQGP